MVGILGLPQFRVYLTESTWDSTLALLSVVTLRMVLGTTNMNTWQDLGSGVGGGVVCAKSMDGWWLSYLSFWYVSLVGKRRAV